MEKLQENLFKTVIRGSADAQAVVYLAVNSETGKEFVGTSFQPLWKGVQTLFKDALTTDLNNNYTDNNREIYQAIRTSSLKDWRIVILEQNVDEFNEKERYFIANYNTSWPGGYN